MAATFAGLFCSSFFPHATEDYARRAGAKGPAFDGNQT